MNDVLIIVLMSTVFKNGLNFYSTRMSRESQITGDSFSRLSTPALQRTPSVSFIALTANKKGILTTENKHKKKTLLFEIELSPKSLPKTLKALSNVFNALNGTDAAAQR